MSLEILKKEIKEGMLRPVYLLFGPEEYLTNYYLKEFNTLVVTPELRNFNYQVLEGKNCVDKVIAACETLPMMSDRKLVIVKETGLFASEAKNKKDKSDSSFQNDIIEYLEKKPKEACLIFVEIEANKKSKMYKSVEERGLCVEMAYQGEQKLTMWVIRMFNTYEIEISKNEAEYLINSCSPGMTDVLNEVNKLIDYMGKGTIVKRKDIDTVCAKTLQAKIFEMIDAITRKDPAKAYELLDDMLVLKEPIQKISVLVARHFKNLLYVKQMRVKGYTPEKIAKETGMQSFAVNKYIRHSGAFKLEELKEAMKECFEMDAKVKTGRINPRLALETFISTYAK